MSIASKESFAMVIIVLQGDNQDERHLRDSPDPACGNHRTGMKRETGETDTLGDIGVCARGFP